MLTGALGNKTADRGVLQVYNAENTARQAGSWLCWSIVTKPDGFSVQQAGSDSVLAPAGVVVGRLKAFDFGQLCAWGLCDALIDEEGAGPLAAGAALMVVTGQLAARRIPASPTTAHLQAQCGIVIAPQTTPPVPAIGGTAWYRVLVRCL
jgi:hypothetical protein